MLPPETSQHLISIVGAQAAPITKPIGCVNLHVRYGILATSPLRLQGLLRVRFEAERQMPLLRRTCAPPWGRFLSGKKRVEWKRKKAEGRKEWAYPPSRRARALFKG